MSAAVAAEPVAAPVQVARFEPGLAPEEPQEAMLAPVLAAEAPPEPLPPAAEWFPVQARADFGLLRPALPACRLPLALYRWSSPATIAPDPGQ